MKPKMRRSSDCVMNEEVYQSVAIEVPTPDGLMFVIIMEDDFHNPKELQIHIGKAGSNIAAWADTTARLATLAFSNGVTLSKIVEQISGITSDRVRFIAKGAPIRSGPEGIALALMKYAQAKFKEKLDVYGNIGFRQPATVNEAFRGR